MQIKNIAPPSQTLDRGLAILEIVADRPRSTDDIAAVLGVHRSIAYRLIRTLEDRHLVERDPVGLYHPGLRLAVLAQGVQPTLRAAAAGELAALADQLSMTAFLVVRDGDEAITLESVTPRDTPVHVVYRPGTRHAIDRGAPGLALLAGQYPDVAERPEVSAARAAGYATSTGEVLAGMASLSAPVGHHGAVAVLWLAAQPIDLADVSTAVVATADRISRRLS